MTRAELESYRSMRGEIRELRERINNLKDDDSIVDADTILDYKTGKGIPKTIVGVNMERYWRKKRRYEKKIENLQSECSRIEEWIEDIEDSITRRIFRLTYIDGKTQLEVGRAVRLERSVISRRIKEYMQRKETQKAQEAR